MTAGKAFRFGVVAAAEDGAREWQQTARRVESLGFATLLTPDNLELPAPTVSLGIASAVTSRLRVGTFVLASPLRTPRAAAWDAHSLTVLTDGRFDLGLGTGLPMMRQAAMELGLPYGNARERLDHIGQTIDHVRRLDGTARTPIMVAAGGPRARELALARADIMVVSQFAGPRAAAVESARELRRQAADRIDDVELATTIFVVGEHVPESMQGFLGADAATLIAQDSLSMLRGESVQAMADELQRRRDTLAVSYVVVNYAFVEQFAPLVERLSGR
jgi:alkanesulfonate monooxygenase SsuD/methylene tetrahydromethanopterin reductase-like flavin-dependent oxidoreductase (luciferase family)